MADDLYAAVTATMIEQLREGVQPWQIPWNRGDGAVAMRPLRHSGEPYSGANVQGWLEVLENDTRAIFQAASHAQRAVTWLHGFSQHRNLAEDMPVADVPRRLDEAGPSARPMYDIECGGAVVECDRISWREPVWRENPGGEWLGGRCVI